MLKLGVCAPNGTKCCAVYQVTNLDMPENDVFIRPLAVSVNATLDGSGNLSNPNVHSRQYGDC